MYFIIKSSSVFPMLEQGILHVFETSKCFNVTFQERTQCLMVMIQDGQFLNAPEKPLHIIRDPMRVQRGRDLVQDL